MNLYNAEISAGSLMIPESRKVAALMLSRPTQAQWDDAIEVENILQKKPTTARRQARLLRRRLETLDDAGLGLIVSVEAEACGQILLAASIRHSRLIGDFMRHDGPHPTASDVGTPWYSLDYVYRMEAGEAVLPRPPIK